MKNEFKTRKRTIYGLLVTTLLVTVMMTTVYSCSHSDKTTARQDNEISANQSTALPDRDSVFMEVDEMPVFKGGNAALLKYVAENTKYPDEAKKNNITGKVLVKFVVEKDGSISNVGVEQGTNYLLDSEAYRVVSSLPKFEKPAIKNGEEVAVQFMLPITFALK